ncbi:MAG: glutamate--tRNA ligase [Clostridia bacterium]|nr:glutamate--tRNA ligase [Clostridia bacterium]
MKVRTRFAPSPTGFMHIGNLRTALYAYLFAKKNGGDFILRIEDTDQERFVAGAIELVYRTLESAGIVADESPARPGDCGPYIQSERKTLYAEYARKLVETGGAYYCFCDKERLESLTDENGNRKYDKHCLGLSKEEVARRLAAGEPYVVRQNIPREGTSSYEDLVFGTISVDCADLEDNILLKSDGMPTYNFANVIDDHLMRITHVIRGTEYLSSTPKYNLIYKSFGWETPQYMHLPPIMKDAQRKLSKRYGDANFEDFIAKGYLAEAIVNYIALLGWSPKNNTEKMTLSELIENFSVDGIGKSGSIFDEEKMRWLNAQYIKELPFERFCTLAKPFYETSAIAAKYDYNKFSALLQSRIDTLGDIPEKVIFIEDYNPNFDTALYIHKKNKTTLEIAKTVIDASIKVIETLSCFEMNALHDAILAECEALDIKKGAFLWCFRIALTAHEVTPGGAFEMADLLGKTACLTRLHSQSIRL